MTLYLDTSALVKRYLAEAGTPEVVAAMAAAPVLATSVVTYAEMRAAFARALRAARIGVSEHAARVDLLDTHWPYYVTLAAEEPCMREAGRLIDRHARHALRGFDAIHLASALRLASGDPRATTFACWDQRLWRAARDEGFGMLPATEPQ